MHILERSRENLTIMVTSTEYVDGADWGLLPLDLVDSHGDDRVSVLQSLVIRPFDISVRGVELSRPPPHWIRGPCVSRHGSIHVQFHAVAGRWEGTSAGVREELVGENWNLHHGTCAGVLRP